MADRNENEKQAFYDGVSGQKGYYQTEAEYREYSSGKAYGEYLGKVGEVGEGLRYPHGPFYLSSFMVNGVEV